MQVNHNSCATGGLEVKVKVGNHLGYRSSAGLLEGWLGKSKVKGGDCAKDKGGPGMKIRKFTGMKNARTLFGSKKFKGKSSGVNYLSLIDWLQPKGQSERATVTAVNSTAVQL